MKVKVFGLATMALSVLLLACSGGSNGPANLPTTQVRVVHSALDITKPSLRFGSTNFGARGTNAITGLQSVPVGTHALELFDGGTSLASQAGTALQVGTKYTVYTIGRAGKYAVRVSADATPPPATGQGRVRFLNGNPDAALDFYLLLNGSDPIASTTPVVSNLAFGAFSDFITAGAGGYTVVATTAGTTNERFRAQALTVSEGSIITAVFQESMSGYLVNTLVVDEAAGTAGKIICAPRVRFLASGATSSTYTFSQAGVALYGGASISDGGSTDYHQVNSNLDLVITRNDGATLFLSATSLDSGEDNDVAVDSGLAFTASNLTMFVPYGYAPPSKSSAYLGYYVHGMTLSTTIDFLLDGQIVRSFTGGGGMRLMDVQGGGSQVVFRAGGNPLPMFDLANPSISRYAAPVEGGSSYHFSIVHSPTGPQVWYRRTQ